MARTPSPVVREEACRFMLDGRSIDYTLRRSARRTLAMQVDRRGLGVSAPWLVTLGEIERFLQAHADWLVRRLADHASQRQASAWQLHEGALLPLFGRPCRVHLVAARSARWRHGADGVEEILLPSAGEPLRALRRALARRALSWFEGRVAEYCHRLALPVPAVRLTSARTRWGSCSPASGIRLHWRLVHLPPGLSDYVVAHEVAHLVELNHSPRFWAVVERLYPDWREARRALRAAGASLPALDADDSNPPTPEED